jgi:hypothetical protein
LRTEVPRFIREGEQEPRAGEYSYEIAELFELRKGEK